MKKIFTLTLLAILGMSSAWADEVTMKYAGSTTSNMKADGSNEAATFGLDASAWSVTADKGAASYTPGLNKAGDFRLYGNANGGNTITVSSLTGATVHRIATRVLLSKAMLSRVLTATLLLTAVLSLLAMEIPPVLRFVFHRLSLPIQRALLTTSKLLQ